MPHIVNPQTKRYKLAQKILHLLFGYKDMYISIWPHSALSAGGLFLYKGKLLIAKRGGDIEHAGQWYIPGGHIDNEKLETAPQALAREMYEEHKIQIDTTKINEREPFKVFLYKEHCYTNMLGTTLLEQNLIYELSDEEASSLQTTEEAPEFKFVDKEELQTMEKQNLLIKDMSHVYELIA